MKTVDRVQKWWKVYPELPPSGPTEAGWYWHVGESGMRAIEIRLDTHERIEGRPYAVDFGEWLGQNSYCPPCELEGRWFGPIPFPVAR